MELEHPNGTLFVSGYGMPLDQKPQTIPRLWKSTDRGQTWTPVKVGGEANGAIGNSDVDLAVARDGTVYFVTMGYDAKTFEGTHIAVGVSKDVGITWHWTMLDKTRLDDRPWVAVAPDGTAHVIWNDGTGVYHKSSHDGGTTWSPAHRIRTAGGSSHLAVGPHGEVAVRITPIYASGNKFTEGVDFISVSTDAGATWQERVAPGERDWAPGLQGATPRWVEPLAWDSRGFLYSLWTNIKGVWLARSLDLGKTWKTWQIAEISALSYYPYLVADEQGQLAATWYSGAGQSLRWHLSKIFTQSETRDLKIINSLPQETDYWVVPDPPSIGLVHDTAGEYLSVTFLRNGELGVAVPIRNPTTHREGFKWITFNAP